MVAPAAMSSMNTPSAFVIAERHGVDTDWCRNAALSRASRARVGASRCSLCQACRSGEWFTSPSLLRRSLRRVHVASRNEMIGQPRARACAARRSSGSTATAWFTTSNSGKSLIESL